MNAKSLLFPFIVRAGYAADGGGVFQLAQVFVGPAEEDGAVLIGKVEGPLVLCGGETHLDDAAVGLGDGYVAVGQFT